MEPEIKARLEALEEFMASEDDARLKHHAQKIRTIIELKALRFLVQELALRSGVSEDHFEFCLMQRFRVLLDQHLQNSSKMDKNFAGRYDDRTAEEIPESHEITPLFPDQSH